MDTKLWAQTKKPALWTQDTNYKACTEDTGHKLRSLHMDTKLWAQRRHKLKSLHWGHRTQIKKPALGTQDTN